MEIKARRWLAVLYRCLECGVQSGCPMLPPTKFHREYVPECSAYGHHGEVVRMQIAERRYYTTFAIDVAVSATTVAGTLEKIGPFKVCDIVYPNIRVFREWVDMRQAEVAEQSRQYMECMQIQQAEVAERLKCQEQDRVFLKEVEKVVYRREHAVELEAKKIARALWSEDILEELADSFVYLEDDDHPF